MAVIVPKSSTPPLDAIKDEEPLFTKTWWLFFRAMADALNTRTNQSNAVTIEGEQVTY